jgi:hypothetical protein
MLLIASWGLANLYLAITSISKIKKNTKECNFIWWWALPSGAFVWEDMLIFGLLHSIIALISVLAGDVQVWIVGFLVFWIVRSAGETLYFFLQQFIEPKHHPHEIHHQFTLIRKALGDISDQKAFILIQITMQSITVLSTLALIFVLRG